MAYDPASPDGRRRLIDDLVVRYQPNASGVGAAMGAHRPSAPDATVLTVSNPAPTRLPYLPGAAQEVREIRHRLAGTALDGDEATRGAVLGNWGRHDVVLHMSGRVTIGEPFGARCSWPATTR